MMTLIIGSPDSGKSALAEKLALDQCQGGKKIYIATMVPYGREGRDRVAKHQKMRDGKGFETLEVPRNLKEIKGLEGTTCLLECMSNLVGNEMFFEEHQGMALEELCRLICEEVNYVKKEAKNLILVTNDFTTEPDSYDQETLKYIRLTEMVNQKLKSYAQVIYTKEKGEWKLEKNI